MLAELGASTPKAKASSVPCVTIPEINEVLLKFVDATKRSKDAAAEADQLEDEIKERAEEARIELSKGRGELVKSLELNHLATYTTKHQYKDIPLTDRPAILALVGERISYFPATNEIKVIAPINNELLAALKGACASLGKKFGDVFSVKQVLKPVEAFTADRVLKPEVAALAGLLAEKQLVVPYSASLKSK